MLKSDAYVESPKFLFRRCSRQRPLMCAYFQIEIEIAKKKNKTTKCIFHTNISIVLPIETLSCDILDEPGEILSASVSS